MLLLSPTYPGTRCGYELCFCRVQRDGLYCSSDCQQAAEQGVDRQYCQCGDPGCRQAAEKERVEHSRMLAKLRCEVYASEWSGAFLPEAEVMAAADFHA
jgi:hypothetical protein